MKRHKKHKTILLLTIFVVFFVMLQTTPAVKAESGRMQLIGGYGSFSWTAEQSADGSSIDWTLTVTETGSAPRTRAYMAIHIPEDYEPIALEDILATGATSSNLREMGNGRDFYYYHNLRDSGNYSITMSFTTILTEEAKNNSTTLSMDVWPAVLVGTESTSNPISFQGPVNTAAKIIPNANSHSMPPDDLLPAPIAVANTYRPVTAVLNLSTQDGSPLPDNIYVELLSAADPTKVYPVPPATVPSGEPGASVTIPNLPLAEYKLHMYGSGLDNYYPTPPVTYDFATSGQVIEHNLVLEPIPANSLAVKVRDGLNKDLLEGVSVTLMLGESVIANAVTDASGGVVFYDLPAERYHLVLERTGYLPVTTGQMEPGNTHMNLHMLPDSGTEGVCTMTATNNGDGTITWRVIYNEEERYYALGYDMTFKPSPGLGEPIYLNGFTYNGITGNYRRYQAAGRASHTIEFITPIIDDSYDIYSATAQLYRGLDIFGNLAGESIISVPITRLRTINPVYTTSTLVSGTASANSVIHVWDVNGTLLGRAQTDAAGYYVVSIPPQPVNALLTVQARYNNQMDTKTTRVLPAVFDPDHVVDWEICQEADLYLDEGTPLDLSQLQVCLYDIYGTTQVVSFADFAQYGITTNHAQGALLPVGPFTLTLQKAGLSDIQRQGYINPMGMGNPINYTTDDTGTYPTIYAEGDHLRNYDGPTGGADYPDAFLSKKVAAGNVAGAFSIDLMVRGQTLNGEPTIVNGIVTDPMGEMVDPDLGTDGTFDYADIVLKASDGSYLGADGMIYDDRGQPVADSLLSGVQLSYDAEQRTFILNGLQLGDQQWVQLSYRLHLRTEDSRYEGNFYYQTNRRTTLQLNGDLPNAGLRYFPIPSVQGDAISVEKSWLDTDLTNIDHVTLDIYRGNESAPVLAGVQVFKNDNWIKELKGLAPYNNQGEPYIYTAMETAIGDTPGTEGFDVSYRYANNKLSVTNRNIIPKHTVLNVCKVDRLHPSKTLIGANFTLYDANTNQPVEDKNTGVGGVATFTFEEAGTYYLQETNAPPGYSGTSKNIGPIVTDGSSELEVAGDPDGDWVVYADNPTQTDPTVVRVFNDKHYPLAFLKVDDNHNPIATNEVIFEVFHLEDTYEDLYGKLQVKADAVPVSAVQTYYGRARTDDIFVPGRTYAIREAKYPNGYVGLMDVLLVELSLVDGEPVWSVVEPHDNLKIIDNGVVEVLNRRAQFPKTGGIGSAVFVVIGVIIAVGAWRLKKKKPQ